MNNLVIIGAGGHGKVLADIAKNCGYRNIVFLDDSEELKKCGNYIVVGTSKDIQKYLSADFIVAIGNSKSRQKVLSNLESLGVNIITLIHPKSVIGENVLIGKGTAVMAGAIINPSTTIGKGCIINTASSVDHDCIIGDFAHVSVGAHVAGTVVIGERTWIGAGATVSNNIEIVEDCMIGVGAVVVKNIEESATYIGIPARKSGGGR